MPHRLWNSGPLWGSTTGHLRGRSWASCWDMMFTVTTQDQVQHLGQSLWDPNNYMPFMCQTRAERISKNVGLQLNTWFWGWWYVKNSILGCVWGEKLPNICCCAVIRWSMKITLAKATAVKSWNTYVTKMQDIQCAELLATVPECCYAVAMCSEGFLVSSCC